MSKLKIIELLRCAEINCDNSKRVPVLIDLVKVQIQEAIKELDKPTEVEAKEEERNG